MTDINLDWEFECKYLRHHGTHTAIPLKIDTIIACTEGKLGGRRRYAPNTLEGFSTFADLESSKLELNLKNIHLSFSSFPVFHVICDP